jgi:citrate lyase beta subunit
MPDSRQPVHTVFGGAHLFRAGVVSRFRELALASLDAYAGDAAGFQSAFGIESSGLAARVLAKVREKLQREPIEDYRIDFEDGYGTREDAEEDGHAVTAAREVAAAMAAGTLPWRAGIRVKSWNDDERVRCERTLRLFLATLMESAGRLPERFIVNLPKVTSVAQVEEFDGVLSACERERDLPEGSIQLEVMIETPGIVMGPDGRSPLPLLLKVGKTRVGGAIFGAYDFTSALGISASRQSLLHPSCDFARNMMLVAFAGSWVHLSDGATAVLPVPLHAGKDGALTPAQLDENRRSVHAAWRVHRENIRHAMSCGFYQGWDLHPAQLVSRYAATFEFFIEGLEPAAARVKNFLSKSAQATRLGTAFDDMATALGLGNHFRRAVSSGAITQDEMDSLLGFRAASIDTND